MTTVTEDQFVKRALVFRKQKYKEMTQAILDHIKVLLDALDARLFSQTEKHVEWDEITVDDDLLYVLGSMGGKRIVIHLDVSLLNTPKEEIAEQIDAVMIKHVGDDEPKIDHTRKGLLQAVHLLGFELTEKIFNMSDDALKATIHHSKNNTIH